MKRMLSIVIGLLLLFSGACGYNENGTGGNTGDGEPEGVYELHESESFDFTREWYDKTIEGFRLDSISRSAENGNAVAEYRVIHNVALWGYYYYSVQAFGDGTGRFLYKVHFSEDFDNGIMLMDEEYALTKEETRVLLEAMEQNDFWNIPTVHPDEKLGYDGETYFVEGYADGREHFIHMWHPGDDYQISKIGAEFYSFNKMISRKTTNEDY